MGVATLVLSDLVLSVLPELALELVLSELVPELVLELVLELALHRDDTLLSFNVSLVDGFVGGGTCFAEEWPTAG